MRAERGVIALAFAVSLCAPAHALFAISWDDGKLYKVNPDNANVTLVGPTGIANMAEIEMSDDGFLYGFTTGTGAKSYQINPDTGATTELATIGLPQGTFVFEGAMSYIQEAEFWVGSSNHAGNPTFFRMDATSGNVFDSFAIEGNYDMNGWAAIGNGQLYGIDRESKAIQLVDLNDKTVSHVIDLPFEIGEVGGACAVGDYIYFCTGGPGSVIPGSNKLYRFLRIDPTSVAEVGPLNGVTGWGFSGLAAPEPGTFATCLLGMLALLRRNKR